MFSCNLNLNWLKIFLSVVTSVSEIFIINISLQVLNKVERFIDCYTKQSANSCIIMLRFEYVIDKIKWKNNWFGQNSEFQTNKKYNNWIEYHRWSGAIGQ